jgi:polygalacturonase
MKSGRDAAGRLRAMPVENVTIRGCTVYASHGGFVIGSDVSGGARNMVVTNCTFIGTDIGLRFKTTRGRGGVVENIFVKDIQMKEIAGEAVLFDMYCAANDPTAMVGESRALPVVELKPVDETTPVFKNFTISNVICAGAETGIFIRGLPEMHVQDVVLQNMVLQARKGFDIQEASNISFKQITILSSASNPVIDIVQSDRLSFDAIKIAPTSTLMFRISGDRSGKINVANTPRNQAVNFVKFELGASEKSMVIQ